MRFTMVRLARTLLRFFGAAILAGVVSASVFAANVNFVGSVGRSTDYATFAILTVDGIHNYDASGNSANLRVELWASLQPFSGSYASAYRLCKYDVGTLASGASTPRLTPFVQPFTVPPNGTYYFAMVLTEYTGGAANEGYTIRNYIKFDDTDTHMFGPPPADTTPPTVSIAGPTSGNVSGTIMISANASDNIGVNRVDFYVNGKYIGADATTPFQYSWNTTTAPNGAATLYAKAFDAKGNSAQSATVTVNVANGGPPPDTTPPTASITSPTSGNVAGTVTISANASDNVGVARVDFYVKGVLVGSDATAPFQYSWNTTALANGNATLYAKAFDAAGNSAQSATVTVNVNNAPPPDTTPPTASITSPTSGNVAGTVTVSANASDNVGVARVDFYVNGALAGSDATAPFQYSWNTTALANGNATLYAKAFDAAGNSAQSATVTVNVNNAPPPDTTPPTASITSPTSGNVAGTVTVSANASDNVGVARVDFYVKGVLVGSDATAPFQYSWNTTALANGNATLYAKAFDAAGNSAQSATVTVNVNNAPPPDTTPPTASITSPTSGNVAGTVTVSANASDNVGVARVDFYVNGALAGSDATAPFQYSWNTTALANGNATLYAKAFDAAGNSAQSATVTVNVNNAPPPDTTPPTASITSPTSGNVAGTVTVSANASDNVGVARVDFYVNGALAGSDATAPFQYSWNTTALANGNATLYAKAFDAAGNSAQSATVTVNVANGLPPDTTAPTVSITSPTGGIIAGSVTISANASDNVGVARVDFYLNGKVLPSKLDFRTAATLLGSDSTAPYQISWDTTALADGTVTLYATAFDAAGNSTQSAIVTVNIANSGGRSVVPTTSYAIEYHNALLDHYFVSASATDINMLDSGRFVGWSRTGYAFKVYAQPSGTANPVCRFYLPPDFGDSHFYSASPAECADVLTRFPMFVLESSDAFYANSPDPDTGACPANMTPVYRMWNGRSDANHRYVTDPSLRDQLLSKGYVAEGYGPDAVSLCAPM